MIITIHPLLLETDYKMGEEIVGMKEVISMLLNQFSKILLHFNSCTAFNSSVFLIDVYNYTSAQAFRNMIMGQKKKNNSGKMVSLCVPFYQQSRPIQPL